MNQITINIEKYYFLGSHMLYYISVFNMIKLTFARALALKKKRISKDLLRGNRCQKETLLGFVAQT